MIIIRANEHTRTLLQGSFLWQISSQPLARILQDYKNNDHKKAAWRAKCMLFSFWQRPGQIQSALSIRRNDGHPVHDGSIWWWYPMLQLVCPCMSWHNLCVRTETGHKDKSDSRMEGGQNTSMALLSETMTKPLETMTKPLETSRTRCNYLIFHLVLPPSPLILYRQTIPSWCGTLPGKGFQAYFSWPL